MEMKAGLIGRVIVKKKGMKGICRSDLHTLQKTMQVKKNHSKTLRKL